MENKWANLTDGSGSVDPELLQFLLHNYLPTNPEPEPIFYHQFTSQNEVSTSNPIYPEPEPQFYTPFTDLASTSNTIQPSPNPKLDIPFTNPTTKHNQASTSNPVNPEHDPFSNSDQTLNIHWTAYQTNFEEHVKLSWNYISLMECEGVPRKRKIDKFIKISELAPTPKKNEDEIPRPVCTCTGEPRNCYYWDKGGWQSSCCTAKMSVYPLPKNPKHKSRRIGGRKMSPTRFKQIFDDLKAQGYDISKPIDLKDYWINKYGEE